MADDERLTREEWRRREAEELVRPKPLETLVITVALTDWIDRGDEGHEHKERWVQEMTVHPGSDKSPPQFLSVSAPVVEFQNRSFIGGPNLFLSDVIRTAP